MMHIIKVRYALAKPSIIAVTAPVVKPVSSASLPAGIAPKWEIRS
jgi:hypothetical protein